MEQLFAWLNMAFSGEGRYNDLMLGFTCIFADHPPGSPYPLLLADAMARLPGEEERVGEATSLRQRERGSLGAMGAGQWTGQFRTRPHALLDVRGQLAAAAAAAAAAALVVAVVAVVVV